MQSNTHVYLALDVGNARIGVARANSIARIASPLTTLNHTASIMDDIKELIMTEGADRLVVGLPRGLSGQETPQTHIVREFVAELKQHVPIEIAFQDEALTSQKAETELNARRKPFSKGDIDALAATYILDDYLQEHPKEN